MIFLMFVALVGGAATVASLWSYSVLLALISAPFGGSALAVVAAALFFVLRTGKPALAHMPAPVEA